jgi:Carboxypeptidase regulatory-like domain/TonB dependent receptor
VRKSTSSSILIIVTSLLLVLSFFTASTIQAQLTEGTIDGIVTDASGASVNGAKVSITNNGTQAAVEAITDTSGYYRVAHLPPGAYSLRVQASGFKVANVEHVAVNVNAVSRADVHLQVGSVTETVNVTDVVPLIQTEEGRLSDTLATRVVNDLPLNGRQVYQLVTLQPGVTATTAPVISSVPSPTSSVTFDFGFIANGATPRGNNFVLDGISNNNEWLGGQPLIYPSLESVQELQVQTLNFSAEYGRNNGAIVQVITKSGTNDFHGTVFYSGRNTVLNARNFFDTVEKTPLQQNQFGFSLGGPIRKDKTFFFIDYEGSRLKDGAPAIITTENPAHRAQLIADNPDTFGSMFLQDFPGPNCSDGTTDPTIPTCQASVSQIAHNSADQYMVRGDHRFGAHDQLFARWVNTLASGDVARQELLGAGNRGFGAPFDGFFAALAIGYTHTFSNTLMNDLRFSYTRNNSKIGFTIPPSSSTANILKAAGKPQDFFGDLVIDDGTIPFGGELFIPRDFVFNNYGINETVLYNKGPHAFKFGVEWRHIQENSNYTLETHPFYEFASIDAFAADAAYLVAATINRQPDSAQFGQFTDTPRHFRWSQWGLFAQDDWKINPRLTLNLGLRWDIFGTPNETQGILTNIVLGSGTTRAELLGGATVGRVSSMWDTDYHDFAPRIGLAWDPFGHGTTVVRSGFSMAYNEAYSNLYTNASRLNPPDASTMFVEPDVFIGTNVNYTFPFVPSTDFANPTTANGGVVGVTSTPSGVDKHLRGAYAMQWFLGVQHQFLHDYAFSINYVGTRGVGGYTREDFNRFDGDICNVTTCDFTNDRFAPGWGQLTYVSNESHSTYHGLNAQLKRSMSHGLLFTANYTLGKVLDNVTEGGLGDYFNVNSYGGLYSGVADIENPKADRGPSEFDVQQRFTLSALWSLPFFNGKSGVDKVLGGWQLNTIIALQSGRPFDVFCGLAWFAGCDFNEDGLAYDRPDRPAGIKTTGFSNQQLVDGVFGNPSFTSAIPDPQVYINGIQRSSLASSVFCPSGMNSILTFDPQCLTVGTNGNMGRNSFRGPAFKDVDFSVFKNFNIREHLDLQFRWEIFNLFNRVNLFNPTGDMGSSQFGRSTAAFAPRQMQFGLKLVF